MNPDDIVILSLLGATMLSMAVILAGGIVPGLTAEKRMRFFIIGALIMLLPIAVNTAKEILLGRSVRVIVGTLTVGLIAWAVPSVLLLSANHYYLFIQVPKWTKQRQDRNRGAKPE